MKKRVEPDKLAVTIEAFHSCVEPWCREHGFSLHQAFEVSRETEPAKHEVLSQLWQTLPGKEYLRSYFRSEGGVLKHRGNS